MRAVIALLLIFGGVEIAYLVLTGKFPPDPYGYSSNGTPLGPGKSGNFSYTPNGGQAITIPLPNAGGTIGNNNSGLAAGGTQFI